MRSDRELLGSYLEGDEQAFEAFYRRHRRPLYVYLLSLVKAREVAEELLQETFLSLLGRLEALQRSGRDDLRPYLLQVARSRAIDHLRRERRERRLVEERRADPLLKRTERAPGESLDVAEELDRELRRLPDSQREVVVLRGLLGLTFPEIARIAGIPENTAVSRYRYGLEKLRAALTRGGTVGRVG